MVIIFSGPICSGKTTNLQKWAEKEDSVGGILMPVKSGKRCFYSVASRETYQAEINPDKYNGNIVNIGKYLFSEEEFKRANREITKSFGEYKNIIIDEIGPLELLGNGFCASLEYILKNKETLDKTNLILVVREGMTDKVANYFNLTDYSIINKLPETL